MDGLPINADVFDGLDSDIGQYDDNPKVVVRTSPIHGRGVFARVDIPAFTHIGRYEGPETQRDGMHVLWLYDELEACWYGIDGVNEMRFLNHADEPNAEWSELDLYATEFIPAGSEITFDYGWDEDDEDNEGDLQWADGPGEFDADGDHLAQDAFVHTKNQNIDEPIDTHPGASTDEDCLDDEIASRPRWGVWSDAEGDITEPKPHDLIKDT